MSKPNKVENVERVGNRSDKSTIPTNLTSTNVHLLPSREPRIIDAIRDQDGREHFCVGNDEKNLWFSSEQLLDDAKDVFRRLMRSGVPMLHLSSQDNLRKLLQKHSEFRSGLAAKRPGWFGNHFVCGDGKVISPPEEETHLIVSFGGHTKFTPVGTLAQWQKDLAGVQGQSNCLFALAVGFAGAVAPFMPPDYTNPFVEFVGPAQSGKSTLGALAASVFAGRTGVNETGGESWSLTRNSLPALANMHRHQTLFLDEANLVQESGQQASDFYRGVIFSLAEGYDKLRYGDPQTPERYQCAVISSANQPLRELMSGSASMIDALNSRVITVEVSGPLGVLDQLPEGFASPRQVIEGLRAAVKRNFGVGGEAFVTKLAKIGSKRREKLDAFISKRLTSYMEKSASFASSPRIQKQFAMIAVAGHAAQHLKVIPEEWGSVFDAVLAVHARVAEWERINRPLTDIEKIQRFVAENRADRLSSSDCKNPGSKAIFERSAGCIFKHEGRKCFMISPKRFNKEFRDSRRLMQSLRGSGHAKTEGGAQPKLVVKPPSDYVHLGRVYWIYLPA